MLICRIKQITVMIIIIKAKLWYLEPDTGTSITTDFLFITVTLIFSYLNPALKRHENAKKRHISSYLSSDDIIL